MKYFKKKGFWVFYVTIVLAGSFIIMALSLQNQSPVIPDVNAQMNWDFYNTPYGTPQVSQTQFGTGFESPGTLSQGAVCCWICTISKLWSLSTEKRALVLLLYGDLYDYVH